MNRTQFVLRNLRSHLRGNLAVLFGAAVGAAVLTGALLVGDSLRGSLRERTERQLGNVDSVLIGPRFLRAEIAEQLPGNVRGAILLQGSVHVGRTGDPSHAADAPEGDRRAGKVSVWGINARFGINRPELDSNARVAILSTNLAKVLRVQVGDTIAVGVQKASGDSPRASLVGKRGIDDTTSIFKLTVTAILTENDPANALNLSISPTLPLNLFIPIGCLQQEIGQKGINALLVSGQSAQSLQSALKPLLTLHDWGVNVRVATFRERYLNVESPRLLLEPAVVDAAENAARELGYTSAKTYSYLANTIAYGKQEIPYAIVAALEASKGSPLGPFLPEGVAGLGENEIVLADWKQTPLNVVPGAPIILKFNRPEIESKIEEVEATFTYRGKVPLTGVSNGAFLAHGAIAGSPVASFYPRASIANDRDLTPAIKGITDADTLDKWDPPFEIKKNRLQQRDKDYWKHFRTAPKAYLRLEDGQRLWGTRFGNTTTIRVAPPNGMSLNEAREAYANQLLANLDPVAGGFVFQPLRERMLEAGKGSTDFGMLFLSFSFFLIIAALMLVGLLFRLNLDRRAKEVGLLRATGFPQGTVRNLLLIEGLILAVIGSALGIAGAFAYASVMVQLLVDLWPTPGVETYLRLHAAPMSVAIGFVASVLMSMLAILWALRSLSKISPSALLKGDTTPPPTSAAAKPSRWPIRIVIVASLCALALALAGPSMPPGEPRAGTFFGSGAMLLTAGLTLLWAWLKRSRHAIVNGHGLTALAKLGSRNAVRNPTRSILTAGLIASAAFLLVAVESFRREPEKDFLDLKGGSGGFPLLAEAATPIDFDLNDNDGRIEIREALKKQYQDDKSLTGPEREEKAKREIGRLQGTTIHRFRVRGGDDASCLNLYQATRPRIFGVPDSIIARGGFSFSATLGEKDNPWKQLVAPPTGPIPCIVEQNTAMWMLKKGLGDTFEVPDEENRPVQLKIVATLKDSVFQSEVLIPDASFRKHFPRTEGFAFFLIDTPADRMDAVQNVLTSGLAGYGFETESSSKRVAAFLAVQNTYLTTFQLLGGFGLLLGVLGLAVVLLRSIWERRSELALLRALGFRTRALNAIVLAENGLLLIVGLAAGVTAALAAVAPHLASGGQIPWLRLGLMLGAVLVVGLAVAFAAVVTTLRALLIPALREE